MNKTNRKAANIYLNEACCRATLSDRMALALGNDGTAMLSVDKNTQINTQLVINNSVE